MATVATRSTVLRSGICGARASVMSNRGVERKDEGARRAVNRTGQPGRVTRARHRHGENRTVPAACAEESFEG